MSGNDVSVWEPAPADVALAPNEVHVWRAWLDVAPDALRRRAAALTQAERERAATFRLARDGARFAAAHGALRTILARYCGVSPAGIRLAAGPYGKPLLADGGGLAFNLSHADDLMLCAVAQDRAVGIDVERVRDDLADREIAARVLSAREAAVLAAVPDRRRTEVFFDLWTRKEAYAKGLGIGLTVLERLEVVPDPVGWALVPLTVAPGFGRDGGDRRRGVPGVVLGAAGRPVTDSRSSSTVAVTPEASGRCPSGARDRAEPST